MIIDVDNFYIRYTYYVLYRHLAQCQKITVGSFAKLSINFVYFFSCRVSLWFGLSVWKIRVVGWVFHCIFEVSRLRCFHASLQLIGNLHVCPKFMAHFLSAYCRFIVEVLKLLTCSTRMTERRKWRKFRIFWSDKRYVNLDLGLRTLRTFTVPAYRCWIIGTTYFSIGIKLNLILKIRYTFAVWIIQMIYKYLHNYKV